MFQSAPGAVAEGIKRALAEAGRYEEFQSAPGAVAEGIRRRCRPARVVANQFQSAPGAVAEGIATVALVAPGGRWVSIRPRRCRRGNLGAAFFHAPYYNCFNPPPALSPRESCSPNATTPHASEFQSAPGAVAEGIARG